MLGRDLKLTGADTSHRERHDELTTFPACHEGALHLRVRCKAGDDLLPCGLLGGRQFRQVSASRGMKILRRGTSRTSKSPSAGFAGSFHRDFESLADPIEGIHDRPPAGSTAGLMR